MLNNFQDASMKRLEVIICLADCDTMNCWSPADPPVTLCYKTFPDATSCKHYYSRLLNQLTKNQNLNEVRAALLFWTQVGNLTGLVSSWDREVPHWRKLAFREIRLLRFECL